jgi:hypothetical protein
VVRFAWATCVSVCGPRHAFRLPRTAHELAHADAHAHATRDPLADLPGGPESSDKPQLLLGADL